MARQTVIILRIMEKNRCDVLKLITGKRIRGKDKCYERRTASRGV